MCLIITSLYEVFGRMGAMLKRFKLNNDNTGQGMALT
jgi:hypothetical protein